MASQSSSGEGICGTSTVVTWPYESEPGENSMTVAMFDHRQCGGEDEVLTMAESYMTSLSGFFCVFIDSQKQQFL